MGEVNATNLVKFYGGMATIRGPEGEYADTLDNYRLDAGKPAPPLPGGHGFVGRTYVPDEYHNLSDGVTDQPQPIPYQTGDKILDDLQSLLDNQAAREATASPAGPDLNVLYNAALDAMLEERGTEPDPPPEVVTYLAVKSDQ